MRLDLFNPHQIRLSELNYLKSIEPQFCQYKKNSVLRQYRAQEASKYEKDTGNNEFQGKGFHVNFTDKLESKFLTFSQTPCALP